jgi:asparagine synthase (glutamine-hydrolysing)
MCGICGKYSANGVHVEELKNMMNAIIHRGPDDEGFYINGAIALGCRRLSIIDLESGNMPIANEDQSIWIVYNGEIYNYKFLRKELQAKGHVFKTKTDTEVIVHLYEEMAEGCLERLHGMFAFALWDQREQKLFLARDRIGQKPLFYSQNHEGFWFASEVKSILAADNMEREIDFESVFHYLSLRFIPSPGTMFRRIKKLPPGHYLTLQNGQTNIKRYWDVFFHEKQALSEGAFAEGLRHRLKETVSSHLVGDVAIGVFLSGGLDSSTIVALMANGTSTPATTFAVGVKEQDFNELPYAKMVADHCHTRHIEKCVDPNLIKMLPRIIWQLDEPSDPIAACMFQAAEMAAQHVKVVLGGDGGDELFGGFDRYRGLGKLDIYNQIPAAIRQAIVAPLISRIPENFAYKSYTQKLRWVQQVSSLPDAAARYAEATFFFRFNAEQKQALLSEALWRKVQHLNSADIIAAQFNKSNASDPVDKMIYTDLMTRLPEHSLMLTDRMTMAHGLEARSPFLDHQLVEYLAAFPADLKIRGRKLKYILRKIAKDFLPEIIVHREKQGFMFPVAYWFRHELFDFLHDFLLASHFVKEGFIKRESVLKLLTEHKNNKIDHHVRLWMLLNLELWHQIYIESRAPEMLEDKMSIYC